MNWTAENSWVALGYALLIGTSFCLVLWLDRRTRLLAQVQAVRDRLTGRTQQTYRTTVQMNDGTQMRFDSTFLLATGDFVEADINGQISPADLLTSQRVIGVVVSVELRL